MSLSPNLKPIVLVISGAGKLGVSVLKGLARNGSWSLKTTVRPSSVGKPEVALLRSLGVHIDTVDWQLADHAELERLFSGVHIAISTIHCGQGFILDQKKLVNAAKEAGVQRFIPCDFCPICPSGVTKLQDEKIIIQEYTKDMGVPYTFINTGIWMQLCVPHRSTDMSPSAERLREYYEDGRKTMAVMNREHIGDCVAKIIAHPMTLNQRVFVYDDETTLEKIYDLASLASGEELMNSAQMLSKKDVMKRARTEGGKTWYELVNSVYIRGDNTAKNARLSRALIYRYLYPEEDPQGIAEYVKEYFATN